jgi:hypothetical protein
MPRPQAALRPIRRIAATLATAVVAGLATTGAALTVTIPPALAGRTPRHP